MVANLLPLLPNEFSTFSRKITHHADIQEQAVQPAQDVTVNPLLSVSNAQSADNYFLK